MIAHFVAGFVLVVVARLYSVFANQSLIVFFVDSDSFFCFVEFGSFAFSFDRNVLSDIN